MPRFVAGAASVLVLAVGGWAGYRRYEASQLSPFRMWETRAGAPFSTFEAEAAEAHRTFQCRAVEGGVRLCEVETGVAGTMRVALDESGRAMIVQWRVADSSLRMMEEARRMAAEWSLVSPRRSTQPLGDGTDGTRWVSADGNWSAFMSTFTSATTPGMIGLVDERRLSRTLRSSAPALLRLAQAGYVDPATVAAEIVRTPGTIAVAARALGAPGRALAVAAAALPECGFQPGDTILVGTEARAAYGEEGSALLEKAIGRAFPGLQLRLERRAYLVDSSGAAEQVRIVEPTSRDDAFAFAISFPRRIEALNHRLLSFSDDTAGRCRASGQVVVGRREPGNDQPLDVRRADADEDAMGTEITSVDFGSDDGSPVLGVGYAATYGTAGWVGVVDWEAAIAPGDDSLRVVRRLPNVLGVKDSTGHEVAGVVAVSGMSPAGLHLAVIFQDAHAPTRLILPAGPRGPATGWVLLDLIK